jgi:membrane-associated phospholipid phosphatase
MRRALLLFTLIASIQASIQASIPGSAHASDTVETAGDIVQVAVPATALALTFLLDDPEGRRPLALSFATTMALTYGLKYAIDRDRPEEGSKSFPSGHTSAAFSGASFIQRRYGWNLGIPAYIAASFVGWTRVHVDVHYVDDALAGAAIGIVSTYLFTEPIAGKFHLTAICEPGVWGIGLTARW